MFESKKKDKMKLSMEPPEEDNKCVDIIKKYFVETSIHGLKYIFEGGRHLVERIFWCIAVLILWCCAIGLIYQVCTLTHYLKIIQNAAFEFLNFDIFHQFLSY